jgi:putative SOS response-associated peptidase YedK
MPGSVREPANASELQGLLKPFPAKRMRAYPISIKVNSVKNDEPSLIEPMMASGGVRV